MNHEEYNEFGLLSENALEVGLSLNSPPTVRRLSVNVDPVRRLSGLMWGDSEPEIVLLHGGSQNAHTWDTVALALKQPVLAIDLPGHGHSDGPKGGPKGRLEVSELAEDVAIVVRKLAPNAKVVVGMSLGGLITLALSANNAEQVRKIILVDVTPGTSPARARQILDFVNGPTRFSSFDEMLNRTIEHNPTRTIASLRRGILHNALQLEDGAWVWRYARYKDADNELSALSKSNTPLFAELWGWVSDVEVPLMLVRGLGAQSVVSDADEAELVRRQPNARIERVEGAGHSIQGDRPLDLARLIRDFA